MSAGMTTNDHELMIDSVRKGLKLVRDTKGSAMYSVSEEIPTYEKSLKFSMKDWSGGHGQFEFEDKVIYYDGQSIDTTADGRIILGPLINPVGITGPADLDSDPVCFCWFSAISKLMMATAEQVYWYDGNYWVSQVTFSGETITDMIEYNGVLYVALGSSVLYQYSTDGENYTATDQTDGYAERYFVSPNSAGTSNVLWKTKFPNELTSTFDGRTTADGGSSWTSPAYVGDTSSNLTNMFLIGDKLLIGKTDNLYHYDTAGGLHPLLDGLKNSRSTQNFRYAVDWQTAMYFSLDTGLGEIYGGSSYEPMGPLTKIDEIGKKGTCVGLASDKDFLYVAMNEGTNTHIYKGREVRKDDVLRWEWCPWICFATGTYPCTAMTVTQHSTTDRRLWFGYGHNTAYVILSDNPTADTAARFAPSGFIRFSYLYGTNPYWDKMWQSAVTETRYCAAGISVTPKYRKDAVTAMAGLATPIITNGVVKTDLTSPLSSKRIQFELDLATNNSTITPEVTYFEVRGIEKPETIRVHEATYAIGTTPTKGAATLRSFLRSGRTSTSLIKFADLRYGDSTQNNNYVWVVFLPGSPEEVEILNEKGHPPEMGLRIKMQEVAYAVE